MRRHIVSHRVLPYRMPAKRQGTLDTWLVMVATKLMLWRRSTACMALVEGIRHNALCTVLIDGIAFTCNPPLHNRLTILERAEQGWQYSMVHVENNAPGGQWLAARHYAA
jgi:hypothetical protein